MPKNASVSPRAILVLAFCLITFQSIGHAATLFEEDFDALADSLRPAVDEKGALATKGWTHAAPTGWTIDNSRMDTTKGVTEWRGWSFTTKEFWLCAENQGRSQYTLAERVFAVADSDEYDDKDGPPPFDSTLISPAITVPAGKTAYVCWDNIQWELPEKFKVVPEFLVSINGGENQVARDYRGRRLSNVEEMVPVTPPAGGKDWTLVLKWRYRAKNGWFWAIDNVRVLDAPPPAPKPLTPLAEAGDWPTYRGDCYRSGISSQRLSFPLAETWVHEPLLPPRPAWPEPAERDVTNRYAPLSGTTIYDRAYHVAAVGNRIYYGSSADDTVRCLDATTGESLWAFSTEGPVRLAPTVTDGKVFFGSDDGWAYCLAASTGRLLWKHHAGPEDRRMPGNERIISRWPIRSGVVVDGAVAYFSAGLFPEQGAYLCAVNTEDGSEIWTRPIGVSTQGYMLASPSRLFAPTGRTAPAAFERKKGRYMGGFEGLGGAFAVVFEDMLAHGPGERGGLHISAPVSREKIVSAPALRLIAKGPMTYMIKKKTLSALDRARYLDVGKQITQIEKIRYNDRTEEQKQRLKALRGEQNACEKWSVSCDAPYAMIMAGNAILTGGDGHVAAYDAETGQALWQTEVPGKAYGLAVARGRLLVSTDSGSIHCFAHGETQPDPRIVAERAEKKPYRLADKAASFRKMAQAALQTSGVNQGYCLVLGGGSGQLAYEIAQASDLHVISIDRDAQKAASGREMLRTAGLLGSRIGLHHVTGDHLPYPKYFANLIVWSADSESRGTPSVPSSEILRVLRPCGGAVVLGGGEQQALEAWNEGVLPGWERRGTRKTHVTLARRGPLDGAGEWTHTYGEPGNSACSGDLLAHGPMEVHWFGRPGPRRMVDRHFRNVPPLYKNGRLFVPGNEVVFAVDAYNGTNLWETKTPGSRRVGVFLDASNMMVTEDRLFVAADEECRGFDVEDGRQISGWTLPEPVSGKKGEWGYLAHHEGLLLGSGRIAGTSYDTITRQAELEEETLWYPNMKVATSIYVFGVDLATGAEKWVHRGGRIIEPTITLGDGRMYFVETTSPAALADTTGRLRMLDVIDGGEQHLVALNLSTGAVVYKRRIDMSNLQQPTFLNYARGVLLLSGSRIVGGEKIVSYGSAAKAQMGGKEPVRYHFYAFDAATGAPRWETSYDTGLPTNGAHGEYNRHPTIVGETAFMWPYAHNIETGERLAGWRFDRHGHGCGGISASADGLFWRGHNPWMYDLRPGGGPTRINEVSRPGCWINIIPAGGLLLIPEASSGCSCGYSIQTSLAYAPREAQQQG